VNAIYNEIEPYACEWLDALVNAGHIAPGRVERRSIADLTADDVAGSGQRHFFAGIGGWSAALRLAGVPDDADVWTGSCPCQPFSSAGKRSGTRDPRHLWPAWFALIEQCRPPVIFGEQVASRDGLAWLDAVYADLERCGYAVGAADLCAASVGAPHIRQRLFFVAYSDETRRSELGQRWVRGDQDASRRSDTDGRSADGVGHDAKSRGWIEGNAIGCRSGDRASTNTSRDRPADDSEAQWLANADIADAKHRNKSRGRRQLQPTSYAPAGVWSDCEWINCTDGVSRSVEPGTFPLAHGVSGRVGRLRGYGNAIVPQVAAAFIRAALT